MPFHSTSDRLYHGRYKEEEEILISYREPNENDYKVLDADGNVSRIPVEALKASLQNDPNRLQLLNDRIESLGSFLSLDYDAEDLQVTALSTKTKKHGSRYLNDVVPCYKNLTLKEAHDCVDRNLRAPNGKIFNRYVPLYLNEQHAESCKIWMHHSFSGLVNVHKITSTSGKWNDLWIPDALCHLMTQAIVDFSEGNVSEPGCQFVLDCLLMMVYCCRQTDTYPRMVSSMKKYLRNFINLRHERTRDKVPDLGDLMQCFGAVAVVDNTSTVLGEDLVSALIAEAMRRQARWVGKYLIENRDLRPQKWQIGHTLRPCKNRRGHFYRAPFIYEETEQEMLVNFVRTMPKQELIDVWWTKSKTSWRVVCYSVAFSKTLTEGKTWEMLQEKYDPVLGAIYPEDISSIKSAKAEIERLGSLEESLLYISSVTGHHTSVTSPDSNMTVQDRLHGFCLWAMDNRMGYVTTDPSKTTKKRPRA